MWRCVDESLPNSPGIYSNRLCPELEKKAIGLEKSSAVYKNKNISK